MNTLATKIREHCLRMTNKAKVSHIGSCLSCADILAVLYGSVIKKGDRFIMSKGHAAAALYATLAECGYFSVEKLEEYCLSGSDLIGHVSHKVLGVDVSTGALGHGLAIGCSMARESKNKVYVLLGDGDCNEGSTWEAAMFAAHHKLHNLIVIVDYNQLQALGDSVHVLNLKPLDKKWEAFGWEVKNVSGHNTHMLEHALKNTTKWSRKPKCIIAHTIKGKGVKWMQNRVEWHYRYPSDEELRQVLGK